MSLEVMGRDIKISTAVTPAAGVAGQTTIYGSTLDMSGFDAMICIVRMGVITNGAATSIKLQHADSSDFADGMYVAGSVQAIADTADNNMFVIGINKPIKRYIRLCVTRATQNSAVASAEYFQYFAKNEPITQGTGVTVINLVSPANGTT